MAELTDPFLELKWGYDDGEDGWGSGMNANLIKLGFFQSKRINGSVSSLPGTPSDGDAYFLTTDQRIYIRGNSTWYNSPIPIGTEFILKSNEETVYYDGTATLSSTVPHSPLSLSLSDVVKAVAITEGIGVRGALDNNPATPLSAQDSRIVLQNLSGLVAGYFGFTQSSSTLRLENRQRSGLIRAVGLDAAGAEVTFFTLDPVNGDVALNGGGAEVAVTTDSGSGGLLVDGGSGLERVLRTGDNVAFLNTGNTYTDIQTISEGTPRLRVNETDAPVNNRLWEFGASSEQLYFAVVNDGVTVSTNWLEVDRTGTTVDTVNFASGTLQYGGVEVAKLDGSNLFTQLNVDSVTIDGNAVSTPDADTTPSDINLLAGSATTVSQNALGGAINITAGDGHYDSGTSSLGAGGAINITSGNNTSTDGRGGQVNIVSGNGGLGDSNTANSGTVKVTSGHGVVSTDGQDGGKSGETQILAGFGGSNTAGASTGSGGTGGDVLIKPGRGGDTNNTGADPGGSAGDVQISAHRGGNATAGTGDGGAASPIIFYFRKGGTSVGGSPGANSRLWVEDQDSVEIFSLEYNGDVNFSGVVQGATQLNVDNLRLDQDTISSTNTNGNVEVAPNGTGLFRYNSVEVATVSDLLSNVSDITAGASVQAGSGDDSRLELYQDDGTTLNGYVESGTSFGFVLHSELNGNPMIFQGKDSGGTTQNMLTMNPESVLQGYNAGVAVFSTTSRAQGGFRVINNKTGTTDTLERVLTESDGNFQVTHRSQAAGGQADECFFIATRAYQVIRIRQVHSTAESTAGTLNIQVTKDTGTSAPGAGTDLLTNNANAGFDAKAAANTVQTGSLTGTTANLQLAAGDRLSVDYSAAATELAGVVLTVDLMPI